MGFNINLDSHHINHIFSENFIKPNFPERGIETRYINKIPKEMATVYARFLNQYIFSYQTVFSARLDKQDEDGQMLDEIEFYINIKITQFLTEYDIGNIDMISPLENQFQMQEIKDCG